MDDALLIRKLRAEIHRLREELEEARKLSSDAIDTMMRGEQVREQIMLQAILSGAFSNGDHGHA